MPANDVSWPTPLIRFPTLFPGQLGVSGTDNENGLRSHSTGCIFYVDPNYPGVSDARDGTNPDDPLETVAAALTKCQPYRGDVIAVMANNAWQFGKSADGFTIPISEEVIVTVPGIRIVGVAQAGSLGVIWNPVSNGGTCISVHACDVTIEGFCFDEGVFAGCNGILADWDGATMFGDNLTVRHCTFTDTIDTAIALEFAWYCNIHNNQFEQCDAYGIYVDPAGSGIAHCNIDDNIFHNCTVAMALNGADDCRIWKNQIYNANAQSAAVATNEGIDTTNGNRNMIYDNSFSCLLPVPANGDWDDLNTAGATDAWIGNHCMDGLTVTNPT